MKNSLRLALFPRNKNDTGQQTKHTPVFQLPLLWQYCRLSYQPAADHTPAHDWWLMHCPFTLAVKCQKSIPTSALKEKVTSNLLLKYFKSTVLQIYWKLSLGFPFALHPFPFQKNTLRIEESTFFQSHSMFRVQINRLPL